MFVMTTEWLQRFYGSKGPGQVQQAREWLLRHGKEVPDGVLDEWSKWKHLIEYQPNTPDIVPQALDRIGDEFETELQAHRFINLMRVPLAKAYEEGLEIVRPKSILELGVGGDSAISTSVFLAYLEKVGGYMISVDYHPLETVWQRYKDVPFWKFFMQDSVKFLRDNQKQTFDLIFIDTIHSYEQTKIELELASNMTKAMLVDDIHHPGNDFDKLPGGSQQAWNAWCGNKTDWKHLVLNSHIGLTLKKRVLSRKRA